MWEPLAGRTTTNVNQRIDAVFFEKGNEIILKSAGRLRGGLLFYEKIASLIDDKIKNITDGISKVEKEFFEGTKQKTLNGLLERLETITKKKGIGEIVVKLGQSPTVSQVNQIIDSVHPEVR